MNDAAASGRPHLAFWYDFASPYGYLAAARIETLARAAELELVWRPMLLGPIFAGQAADGSPYQPMGAAERRYRWRDVERSCAFHGLALRRPSSYPRNGLQAARVALLGADQSWGSAFTRAVYEANFVRDLDITDLDVLACLLEAAGVAAAEVIARSQALETKERLRAQVRRAMDLGIFGVPSFVVDGELFWGNDRLDQAIAWARRCAIE